MKPTKMRNKQIYRASLTVRSRQLGGCLSKELQKKHERRSIRIVVGDTVKVIRGEYTDVEGKVSKVDIFSGRIAVEGVKKEKGQGEKFDVMIHASNIVLTSLKTDDSWRIKKLKGVSVPTASDKPQTPATPKPTTTPATPKPTTTPATPKPTTTPATPKPTTTPATPKPKDISNTKQTMEKKE